MLLRLTSLTNTTPPKAHCHDGAIRISFTHWGLFITTCWVPLFDFDCVCVTFSYNSFYARSFVQSVDADPWFQAHSTDASVSSQHSAGLPAPPLPCGTNTSTRFK